MCGWPLATGIHGMGSASAEWSLDVSIYHGPHIGHQFLVTGFLSPTHKERLKHWAHGIKGMQTLDTLDGVSIY